MVQWRTVVLALLALSGNAACASDHRDRDDGTDHAHVGDGAVGDGGRTTGDAGQMRPRPVAQPTDIASISAGSAGKSKNYRLFLGVGAPQPYGRGESSRFKLRMGVRSPQ